ncbi:MAG: penicillin-binding protein 2 [Bacteroidales bacterium]|nr:MAG: penicillin-binding protein 2 [Bacteroidales bacterium]
MNITTDKKYIISGIIILVFIVIIVKLFYIQIVDSRYKFSANNNVLRYITQYPARGLIYDRNGELLVANQVVYDLMIVKNQVKPFDTLEFSSMLGLTVEQVKDAFEQVRKQKGYSPRKSVVLLKQISDSSYARLQEVLYKYQGFEVLPRTVRTYPRRIAGHLFGYVGEVDESVVKEQPYYQQGDYIGINGIEKYYENQLRGVKGVNIFMVDVHNRIKGPYEEGRFDSIAKVGKNLISTIDADLQEYGEKLMINKIGSVVAIEPKTGEVLAMISSPTYNPELLVGRNRTDNFRILQNDSLKPIFNRSIMALYPPGSTFKVVNALIGLQENVLAPSTRYSCYGRYTVGRGVGCHNHPSPLDLEHSIAASCNTYYCHVFRNIIDKREFSSIEDGFNNWKQHVESFGYGNKLGIDLPNELKGIVPSVNFYNKYFRKGGWSSLTIISLSIGQGELGTTPLQMANLVSAIANKGYYYTPHIVKDIEGNDEIDHKYYEKHVTSVDSSYYKYIINGMDLAVNAPAGSGSTARIAAIPDILVCGKTGTSQNPHGEDHSVFFAFAPKDDPKIAIAVYVENAGFGATWAAPIASLMIEKYLKDSISRPYLEEYLLNANLLDRRAKRK